MLGVVSFPDPVPTFMGLKQLTMCTFRSLAIPSPSQELQLQTHDLEAAVSGLPPDGVLVRVLAAGVCHSDIHLWHGGLRVGKDQVVKYADRPGTIG